jgi:hypothetical protein
MSKIRKITLIFLLVVDFLLIVFSIVTSSVARPFVMSSIETSIAWFLLSLFLIIFFKLDQFFLEFILRLLYRLSEYMKYHRVKTQRHKKFVREMDKTISQMRKEGGLHFHP